MVEALNRALRRVPAWPLYVIGICPAVWLWYLGITNQLGPEPIKALEHELGEIGLQLILVGLAITPLRRFAGLNLIRYRRAVGLLAFSYVLQHFAVWLFLDIGILSQIWSDIIKRPYITVGFAAFVLMLPLAATSNNWAVRRLGGRRWQMLHKLTYLVGLGGVIHYIWLYKAKSWLNEPMLYLGVFLLLMLLRVIPQKPRVAT